MHTPVISNSVPAPRGFYSQAVRAGQFVFISGQLPIDSDGSLVGSTIEVQAQKVLDNIRAILEAANARVTDLVQVIIYISDISLWPAVNKVYQETLKEMAVPASRAIVPVKDLHYGALIEVQAVAYTG